LISNVIRYNANDNPTKQTAFSQYDRPQARRRYAEIADHLGLSAPGDRTAAKIEKLLAWLESLKADWVFLNLSVKQAFRKLTSLT
jgi:acetaldehyde dehydrogenase/alcohol dehydrogenase